MEILLSLCILACLTSGLLGKDYAVDPDHLDMLLEGGRYEEFEKYMGIAVAGLSRPNDGKSSASPMMNLKLHEGDILLNSANTEQGRQGVRFDRYPGSRWPGEPAVVPYVISKLFRRRDRRSIQNAIVEWNDRIPCVQFLPRRRESAFLFIFPGAGCYAFLGRTGVPQPLSLGRGCVHPGIIFHELEHTIGMHHEQSRYDRDEYVEVLWENIPPRWWPQYAKTDNETFALQQQYDYYSVMHYPLRAPETGRPAFNILREGIDTTRMGRYVVTLTDEEKIADLYCPEMKK